MAAHTTCTPTEGRQQFASSGFAVCDRLVPPEQCAHLNGRLDAVLRGEYDRGRPPDKWPSPVEQLLAGRTLQIINIWKSDRAFAALATSARIGELVATLAGWRGARLAQDQVWYKPPGAGPIVFHRDTTYFEDFADRVVTVWLALDRMEPEVGPLEYVVGSHRWGDGRRGSAKHFFEADRRALVYDAARREGLEPGQLEIVPVHVDCGGAGVHDGRTWHGSGPNASADRPRRGVGLHFVPEDCNAFKPGIDVGRLWSKYLRADSPSRKLPEADFPVTWSEGRPVGPAGAALTPPCAECTTESVSADDAIAGRADAACTVRACAHSHRAGTEPAFGLSDPPIMMQRRSAVHLSPILAESG
jgi:ectoine hydroxylase-related dioxygenase (phytanoyl-CoA dioxygenase family)